MARKGPQIQKTCVICGKTFLVYPSNANQQCCSKKCGAELRTLNGKRGGTHWTEEAKAAFKKNKSAQKARAVSSKKGLAVANFLPENQRGVQNRTSEVWTLIDPSGNTYKVVGLLNWARQNRELFFPKDVPEEVAAHRIASGFRAIASSMRGVASRTRPVQSYKGWSLAGLPRPKQPGDDGFNGQLPASSVNEAPSQQVEHRPPRKDLTGQRFGSLTVLREGPLHVFPRGTTEHTWVCLCDCGNETTYRTSSLTTGKMTSCGCQTSRGHPIKRHTVRDVPVDLTGQTFGNFVVLGPAGIAEQKSGSGRYLWRIRCKLCGRTKVYDGIHLRLATASTSCGCQKMAPYPKICTVCGQPYAGSRRSIYCPECSEKEKAARAREYRKKKCEEKRREKQNEKSD